MTFCRWVAVLGKWLGTESHPTFIRKRSLRGLVGKRESGFRTTGNYFSKDSVVRRRFFGRLATRNSREDRGKKHHSIQLATRRWCGSHGRVGGGHAVDQTMLLHQQVNGSQSHLALINIMSPTAPQRSLAGICRHRRVKATNSAPSEAQPQTVEPRRQGGSYPSLTFSE